MSKQSDFNTLWRQHFCKLLEENLDIYSKISTTVTFTTNPNITLKFIKNHEEDIDKIWGWTNLSKNKNIKIKDIEDNLDFPWEWNYISNNPNLTFEFVKKYINKNWYWRGLSENSFNGEKEKFTKNYIIQYCFPEHIPFEIRRIIISFI